MSNTKLTDLKTDLRFVMEGGQTKEEEKHKGIFFSEVLAQDEINRLLDPKVLTNFARYTA